MVKTIFITTLLLAIMLGPCWWVLTDLQANCNIVSVPSQVPGQPSSPEGTMVDEPPLSLEGIDKAVETLHYSVWSLDLCIKQYYLICNSLLPLFSLPPEILEYIFLLAVPFSSHHEALFSLGLVCSLWQDIVSHSGRLWSNVLDINDDHCWVKLVLEQSAQVPFGVHAQVITPYDEEASHNLITVLQELPCIYTLEI
ncbi:hypothetical protein BD769DRAFT_1388311 [Suillus cothurnatus]|nr:hypothetical protein BD769DRAFT_1388311 [Suillus cothurnatus]